MTGSFTLSCNVSVDHIQTPQRASVAHVKAPLRSTAHGAAASVTTPTPHTDEDIDDDGIHVGRPVLARL
jgi:hypothetical protein